jgi:anti-sigma B factor antagonist
MPDVQAELTIRKQGKVSVVELKDRKILEELQIREIGERLSDIALGEPSPQILVDFSHVEHLTSGALGMLITLNKQVTENEGKLVLASIHPQIYEVFRITQLNRLFNIQETTADGLKAFN